jgi:RNA polymerase sigma-B factor
MGEVRRYFRDTSWPVRLPRRLQELRLAINAVGAHLAQSLGRPATTADLAEQLGISEDDVAEGLQAIQAFRSVSLDEPASGTTLAEMIGNGDLALRFFGDKTQSQIGAEIGLSIVCCQAPPGPESGLPKIGLLLGRNLMNLRS